MKYPWTKKEANMLPEVPKPRMAQALVGSTEDYGTTPSTSFADQVEVFEKVPIIREIVVHTSMEVTGTGMIISAQGNLNLKLSISGVGSYNAKEAIDYFNELNNTDELMLTASLEIVAYGNSIFTKTDNGLKSLDIKTIQRAIPTNQGSSMNDGFDLVLCGKYAGKILKWGTFVMFRANVTSSSFPFGTGLIKGYLESYDAEQPSMLEEYFVLEKATLRTFRKFGGPLEILHPDTLDADMTDINTEVKKLKDGGGRITTNIPVGITNNAPVKLDGLNDWYDSFYDRFIAAGGDPSIKASVSSGFTEASIKGSITLFRKKVNSYRRILKRGFEQVFQQVLVSYGFDPNEAQIRLEFGADLIEWTVPDLLKAVEDKVVSPEEARVILRKKAGMELEDKAPPKQESPPVDEKMDQ